MDTKKLHHLVILAEERSFSKAATKVHLTQPALSRSIQSLEMELGSHLVDRTSNGFRLTSLGQVVVQKARQILMEVNNLDNEVKLYNQGDVGYLKLGIGPFPAATFIPDIVSEFIQDKPQVKIDITINNWDTLLKNLFDENIDLFVADIREIPVEPTLRIIPLTMQYITFVVRKQHPLSGKTNISIEDMLKYPIISVRLPESLEKKMAALFNNGRGDKILNLICDSQLLLEHIGANSDSIVLTTYAAINKEKNNSSFVTLSLPMESKQFFAEIGICYINGRKLPPPAQWLVQKLLTIQHV